MKPLNEDTHHSPRGALRSLIFVMMLGAVFAISISLTTASQQPVVPRVSFLLSNQHGERVDETLLQGKYTLWFFGFTHCQGVCPIQMAKLTSVLNTLDKRGHHEQIQGVLTTVDPERDTPEIMQRYLTHFHPSFSALTGTRRELKAVNEQFKTYLAPPSLCTESNYQPTHSTLIFLIDPYGRIEKHIPMSESAQAISELVLNSLS